MSFENKTIVITGAAKGIGLATARMYAEKGAAVVLADMDEKGQSVAEELQNQRLHAIFIKTDVTRESSVSYLMNRVYEIYGTIDVLVNNVGIEAFLSPFEITLEEWENVMHTNLRSVFLGTREAAKVMRQTQNGGAIVNIASTRALMSEPHSEAYAASKGGVIGLTHSFAASLSPYNITVNAISPGWIETGDYEQLSIHDHTQHFSNRVGCPGDVAKACLYLSEESNDFVTGTNLVIDGGMTRKMIYEE